MDAESAGKVPAKNAWIPLVCLSHVTTCPPSLPLPYSAVLPSILGAGLPCKNPKRGKELALNKHMTMLEIIDLCETGALPVMCPVGPEHSSASGATH